MTGASPGQDVPLSPERIAASRNFANKLWNAGRYLVGNLKGDISHQYRWGFAFIANNAANAPIVQSRMESMVNGYGLCVSRGANM